MGAVPSIVSPKKQNWFGFNIPSLKISLPPEHRRKSIVKVSSTNEYLNFL